MLIRWSMLPQLMPQVVEIPNHQNQNDYQTSHRSEVSTPERIMHNKMKPQSTNNHERLPISHQKPQINKSLNESRRGFTSTRIGRPRTSAPTMLGQRFPPAEGSSCHFPTPGVAATYLYKPTYTYLLLQYRGRVLGATGAELKYMFASLIARFA